MSSPISRNDHARMVRQIASSQAASRSSIAASWRRSMFHFGLEPDSHHRRDRLTASELRQRREEDEALLLSAQPLLDRLSPAVTSIGGALLLSSYDGLILDERFKDTIKSDFLDMGLTVGARWAEPDEGTNGIGTALAEHRSVMIWRDQHFHARNMPLVCMSAPIDAPDGSIAGVLDISSCHRDLTEGYAHLITTAVQDTAWRISCELFRRSFAKCRIVTVGAEMGQGPCLIAVDANDLVVGANRAACKGLGLTAEMLSLGPPASDIIPGEVVPAGLDHALRSEIQRALRRTSGSIPKAAKLLGIGRSSLYRKIQDLGIRSND